MTDAFKNVLRKAGGILLIVAGLIAMPLPVLPGIPLVIAGLMLMGVDHPLLHKCADWLRDRWQKRKQ